MRWWFFAAVCCCGGGCGSVQYQGWSPSFRFTRDDPGLRDVYVGADATFAVTEPAPYRSPHLAENRTVDAWNTPVAWQPLVTPVAAQPTAEAAASPDALFEANK